MDKEQADKLILRSMNVDMADSMDTVFQLPATTFIGGKVNISIQRIIGINPDIFHLSLPPLKCIGKENPC